MNKDAAVFIPSWLQKNPQAAPVNAPAAPETPSPAAKPAAPHQPASKLPFKNPVGKGAAPASAAPAVPLDFAPTLPGMTDVPPAASSVWKGAASTLASTRTTEQVKEKAAASALSAAASVFIPKSLEKVLHAAGPEMVKGRMSFEDSWTLFYMDRVAAGMEEFHPHVVYEISSVETFWRTMNNIPSVTRLDIGCNYMLFRKGVEPRWEDARNRNGGSWSLQFQTARDKDDTVDAVWDRLCAATVGEAWAPAVRPTVVGVVAKRRERYIVMQVWVTAKVDTFPREFLAAVQDVYPTFQTEYFSHQAVSDYAKEKAAAKPKPKKPRKH